MVIAYFIIYVATLLFFCLSVIFLLRLPYKIKIICIWQVPEYEQPCWRPAGNVLDFIRNDWLYSQEPSSALNILFEDHAYTSKT